MAFSHQLDFFEEYDPVKILEKDFRLLDKKCQNVQRGLFARFATLEETVEMLRDLCYQQKIEIDDLKTKMQNKIEVVNFG